MSDSPIIITQEYSKELLKMLNHISTQPEEWEEEDNKLSEWAEEEYTEYLNEWGGQNE